MSMQKTIFTALLLIFISIPVILSAEAPCTQIEQETLQAAAMCIRYSRATGQLNTDHRQVMNILQGGGGGGYMPPPVIYPYAGGYPGMTPYFSIPGRGYHGYQGVQMMVPYSWR